MTLFFARRAWRLRLRAAMVAAVFLVSAVPVTLILLEGAAASASPTFARLFAGVTEWHDKHVPPVQELRPLAPLPQQWQGRWVDTDKNYAAFERWFADHLGLRNLMIRTKNELDYRLFKSSRRVYYGKDGELYGRNMADNELPRTELELGTQAKRDAAYRGVLRLNAELKAAGVTMVLMTPVAKQYFTRERLPFFAPRVSDDAHFMS